MRYPVEETAEKHERILEQASRLFRERGFSGVSVSEIMKATGLTHGAFYNHFESKEDLVAKSVEHASRSLTQALEPAAMSVDALSAYIQDYLSPRHRDDVGPGCLIASLGPEISRTPSARPAFTSHVRATLKGLLAALPGAKKRAARGDAIRALSGMVGALVLARAVDDGALSEEILREARSAYE